MRSYYSRPGNAFCILALSVLLNSCARYRHHVATVLCSELSISFMPYIHHRLADHQIVEIQSGLYLASKKSVWIFLPLAVFAMARTKWKLSAYTSTGHHRYCIRKSITEVKMHFTCSFTTCSFTTKITSPFKMSCQPPAKVMDMRSLDP